MLDIGIEFFERAFVKQHVEPIARGQLALAVLRVDALLPAPQRGGRAAAFHFGDIGGHAALHDGKPLPCPFRTEQAKVNLKSCEVSFCKLSTEEKKSELKTLK